MRSARQGVETIIPSYRGSLGPRCLDLASSPPSRCITSSMVWWSGLPETRTSSTMFWIRNRPQPRGVCISSSLASRSGTVLSGFGTGCERSVSSLRSFSPHPTPLASPVRYEKRYEAWLLSRKWPKR
jgi:hypothetical protein